MNAEVYATFLKEIGHDVVKIGSLYWYNVSSFSYLSFPFHYLITPTPEELDKLWNSSRVLAIRYPTTDENKGYPSYRVVSRDKGFNLSNLSKKARNQTRRGLENCKVHKIQFEYLAKEGIELSQSTLSRQQRKIPSNLREKWKQYCLIASDTPGFEAWGAFIEDQLAAFIVGFIMDGCYNIFIQRSSSSYLNYYPNNALVYVVTSSAMSYPDIKEVSFGLEPLQEELIGLSHFKESMGFEKLPIKQKVIIKPIIKPILFSTAKLISWIATKNSNKEFWRKLNGMVKFATTSE